MTNLETLTLENCFSLEQLPTGIDDSNSSGLKVLAIKGPSKLQHLPESLLSTFHLSSQDGFSGVDDTGEGVSLPSLKVLQTEDWLVLHRNKTAGIDKLVREAAVGRCMHSLTLKPSRETVPPVRLTDSIYELQRSRGTRPSVEIVFFHGFPPSEAKDSDDPFRDWKAVNSGCSGCWNQNTFLMHEL